MGSIDIASGTVVIDPRSGYLHVVHPGPLATEDEVLRYVIAVERDASSQGLRRCLIDARLEARGVEPPDVRLALWRWLQSTAVFDAVALVMPDALAETRVNMLAVSQRMLLRAFVDSAVALRWLTRASRSTASFRSEDARPRRSSSFPPPVETDRTFGAMTPATGVSPPDGAPTPRERKITQPGLITPGNPLTRPETGRPGARRDETRRDLTPTKTEPPEDPPSKKITRS